MSAATRITAIDDDGLFNLGNAADRAGPFAHGTDLYAILHAYADLGGGDISLQVWKSTDAGATWAHKDAAHDRALGINWDFSIVSSIDLWLGYCGLVPASSPTLLKIAYCPSRTFADLIDPHSDHWTAVSGSLAIATFDMSTDTWGSDTATGPTVYCYETLLAAWGGGVSMAERSDGSLVVLYQDEPQFSNATLLSAPGLYTPLGRAAFAVYSSGWSGPTSLTGAGELDSYGARSVVIGAVDRAHFFLVRESYPTSGGAGGSNCLIEAELVSQSVSAGGSLDTLQVLGDYLPHTQGLDLAPQDSVHHFAMRDAPACDIGAPHSYTSGSDVVVAVPWSTNETANNPVTYTPTFVAFSYEDNSVLKVSRCLSGANPTWSAETASVTHGNLHEFDNDVPASTAACLLDIAGVEHLFWVWHDPSTFVGDMVEAQTLRHASRVAGVWTEGAISTGLAESSYSDYWSLRAGPVPGGLGMLLINFNEVEITGNYHSYYFLAVSSTGGVVLNYSF